MKNTGLENISIRKWFLPSTNVRRCCKGSHTMRVAPALFNLVEDL
jgi:hypothetical protein